MAEPFLGEIKMVGFNFAPSGWKLCNGQIIAISQNQALFALIGTTYGGDGVQTFALPNLQGRVPIHQGTGAGLSTYVMGQSSGVENVTVTTSQLPSHQHGLSSANAKLGAYDGPGNQASPAGNVPAIESTGSSLNYSDAPNTDPAFKSLGGFGTGAATGLTGSNVPVSVVQPYLCVNFVIAMVGIFPSRN